MRYEKCPICNEKLKNGVCPMCGYDFKRLESAKRSGGGNHPDYRVRPNEEPKRFMTKQHKRAHRQFRTEKKRGAGKFIKVFLSFVVAAGVLLDAASEVDIKDLVETVQTFVSKEEKHTKKIPDSTYEYTSYTLEDTGKRYSMDISSGRYVVGLDIPEGIYTMTGTGNDISLSVTNTEQYISIYERLTDRKTPGEDQYREVKNVRLYQGALIEVLNSGTIHCKTSNANLDKLRTPGENPLKKEVEVAGVMTAGKDFPAGTYDVIAVSAEGEFHYTYEQDKDEEYGANVLWLSENSEEDEARKYVNLELPAGTEITISSEEGQQVKLVPSKRVRPDKMQVYDLSNGLDS
ncbi:hypothetical protein [Anaerostipes sp.]|uniref:hypothetical protein n=1 Tax=Anaerostipes sp. TaxID=1872530 RepID=UPI0025C1FD6D|nr:hypothetical protein [Anaerostipes sp.]MBS7007835.1 hypothetical protein [Anaerostipes sp.]